MLIPLQQTSIEIDELMYVAYSKFGDITNQQIDKLRLKNRLKVVQVSSETFKEVCVDILVI